MSNLYFSFLGAPDVRVGEERIKFRSRKELALLIYLAVESGWYGREHLIALLWPESDHKQGRLVFRSTLSRLRKRLSLAGDVIMVEGDKVAFNGALPVVSDLRLVQTAVSPQASIEYKKRALAAVRGSFLAGFSLADAPAFDDWITIQAEIWQQRLERLWDDLSRILLATGDPAAAVETAAQWVAYSPLNEAAYRRLMQAHFLQNGRASALQIYKQCCAVLQKELGVEPDEETQTLTRHIREGKNSVHITPEPIQAVADPTLTPFVGRQQELQQLVALFQATQAGQTSVAIIFGDAGIGKTQLVQSFLNWAAVDSPQVDILRGRAPEIGGQLPYQTITQALRVRIDAENAPDDLLADVWLAELSQLLPELRDRYPDLPLPMQGEPDFVRSRLFEAVATLGIALAKSRPVIFFIDDVQWVDDGSRELLQFLCGRWQEADQAILVVMTVRQEAILSDDALQRWVFAFTRAPFGAHLALRPLTHQDIVKLTAQIAYDEQAVTPFSSWLFQETNGVPFFVAQFLQMLQAEGLLSEQLVAGKTRFDLNQALHKIQRRDGLPLPPPVRDLILSRLAHLDEAARNLLTATAVLGQASSLEWLCQITGIAEMAGLAALEKLLGRRLLLEQKGKRPYVIAHDKIREVVYDETSAARRRITHRRIFHLLESEHSSAAILAYHAEAAQLPEPTFRYALLAGDEAMRLSAFRTANRHYATALKLLAESESTSEQRCRLCVGYGRSLELLGDLAAALAHYEAMTQLAEELADKKLLLTAIVAQATIRATGNRFNDFALAETLCQQALALAQAQGDLAAEAKIRWNLLNVYRWTGRTSEALAAGQQAIGLAQSVGLEEQEAYAANDLVSVYLLAGDTTQLFTTCERAIALWRRLGNQPMLVDALAIHGLMQAAMGKYTAAQSSADEALTIARSLRNRWGEAYSLYTPIYIHLQKMDIAAGLALAETALQLAREVGVAVAQVIVNSFKAQLCLAGHDVAQAHTAAAEAVAVAESQLPFLLPMAKGALALVQMAQNEFIQAEALLEDVVVGEDSFTAMMFFVAETAVCQLWLHQAKHEQLIPFTQKLIAFLEQEQLASFVPQFAYFQASALLATQKPKLAKQAIQKGLTTLETTDSRYFAAELNELLAILG